MTQFVCKESVLKIGATTFEKDNTYTVELYNITDQQLQDCHEAGWIQVEGWDEAPERKPGVSKLKVDSVKNVVVQGGV